LKKNFRGIFECCKAVTINIVKQTDFVVEFEKYYNCFFLEKYTYIRNLDFFALRPFLRMLLATFWTLRTLT